MLNLEGQTFGRLLVLSGRRDTKYGAELNCLCSCGKEKWIALRHLRSGRTKSCGCAMSEYVSAARRIHGKTQTPEFKSWAGMRQRCHNPNHIEYHRYGARGITVCERWADFRNFLSDMGLKPSPQHSIDRINTNGNYEPSNCHWATPIEQANNARSNKRITFNGVTRTVSQWERHLGVKLHRIQQRLYRGWTVERTFQTP